jgi:hypothetical protein
VTAERREKTRSPSEGMRSWIEVSQLSSEDRRVNGQPNHHPGGNFHGGLPGWGPSTAPQPQGTIYIGFDQPMNVAGHPQAAYSAQFAAPQHAGYHTPQNGWCWSRGKASSGMAPQAPASAAKKKSGNTLGLIGFVVSLCGLATAALPVAVAGGGLSALALFRRGRFLALTGLVMALANPAVVEKMQGDRSLARLDRRVERIARVELQKQLSQVNTVLAQAESQILAHYEANGQVWPDGIEGNMLVSQAKDPWGSLLRFDEMGDRLVLRSLGPDQKAETSDDIVLTIHHFRAPAVTQP